MRWLVLLWRKLLPMHHQRTILLSVFVLNFTLYLIGKNYYTDLCANITIPTKTTRVAGIPEESEGNYQFPNLFDDFNWKKETRSLLEVIPVLNLSETDLNDSVQTGNSKNLGQFGRSSDYDQIGELDFRRSEVLDLIKDHIKEEDIIDLLLETYNPSSTNHSLTDATDVYNALNILNCGDIKYLENRTVNPQLTYPLTKKNRKSGELRLHDGYTVNVAKIIHHKSDFDNNVQFFRNILEHFYKLLKTQGWPGIPRIYGACVLTSSGRDATQLQERKIKIEHLSYIVDRYDDGIKICNEVIATDDCVKLAGLRQFIKKYPSPAITSLKIMRGIGETFETLWLNGVLPFEFQMNDLVITKQFEFVFTNLDSFIFLDPGIEPFSYKRVLSDSMCKTWKSCPVPEWRNTHFLFRLGHGCKEVKGHCGDKKRCWGLDSMSYLCAFSKWIFHQLNMLIPLSWKHFREVQNILACSSHSFPEHRCDWTTFVRGVDTMLKLAEEEWGESDKAESQKFDSNDSGKQ